MIQIAAQTHPGKQRSINQDCMVIQDHFYSESALIEHEVTTPLLVMVLDGVGGQGDGRLASQSVAQTIQKQFRNHPHSIQEKDVITWIQQAHDRLKDIDPTQLSLTTLVGMVIVGTQAIVFNVGDSKLYGMKGQKIKKISIDDTLYQSYLKQGNLSFGEQHLLKNSHTITHAIGANYFDPLRIHVETIESNFDYFFLCTDGISDYLDEYALYEIFQNGTKVTQIMNRVMDQVLAGDAADNFTCIVMQPMRSTL